MDPMVFRAKAVGKEGDVHVELMAPHNRNDDMKGPLRVLYSRGVRCWSKDKSKASS